MLKNTIEELEFRFFLETSKQQSQFKQSLK